MVRITKTLQREMAKAALRMASGDTATDICIDLTARGVAKRSGAVGTWYPKELQIMFSLLGLRYIKRKKPNNSQKVATLPRRRRGLYRMLSDGSYERVSDATLARIIRRAISR